MLHIKFHKSLFLHPEMLKTLISEYTKHFFVTMFTPAKMSFREFHCSTNSLVNFCLQMWILFFSHPFVFFPFIFDDCFIFVFCDFFCTILLGSRVLGIGIGFEKILQLLRTRLGEIFTGINLLCQVRTFGQ